jgi:Methyltransferase domain
VQNMLEHFEKRQKTILLEGSLSPLSASYRDRLIALGGNPESIAGSGEHVGEFAPYDLVFVDGDHHEESVYTDLSSVCHYITKDALIILHDLSGYWGIHVFTGINRFRQEHSEFSLQVHENLGFLYRRSSHIPALIKDL